MRFDSALSSTRSRPVASGEYTAGLTGEQAEDDRVLLALEHEGAATVPAGRLPASGRTH